MTVMIRIALFGLAFLAAAGAGPAAPGHGACYCRMGDVLSCTANLTEQDCRRQCDEAICDDWFWKDRLPCWNWGYGG